MQRTLYRARYTERVRRTAARRTQARQGSDDTSADPITTVPNPPDERAGDRHEQAGPEQDGEHAEHVGRTGLQVAEPLQPRRCVQPGRQPREEQRPDTDRGGTDRGLLE